MFGVVVGDFVGPAIHARIISEAVMYSWWWSRRVVASIGWMMAVVSLSGPVAAQQHDTTQGARTVLQIPAGTPLPANRRVVLGLHKAMIVELPADAQDVLVSHPNTIDVVIRTARRVFVLAKEVGEANVFFIGREGQRLLVLDMTVKRDLTELGDMLHRRARACRFHPRVRASSSADMLPTRSTPAGPRRSPRNISRRRRS